MVPIREIRWEVHNYLDNPFFFRVFLSSAMSFMRLLFSTGFFGAMGGGGGGGGTPETLAVVAAGTTLWHIRITF